MGLISEGKGVAVAALRNLGVDLKDVRQKIEGILNVGTGATMAPDLLPRC